MYAGNDVWAACIENMSSNDVYLMAHHINSYSHLRSNILVLERGQNNKETVSTFLMQCKYFEYISIIFVLSLSVCLATFAQCSSQFWLNRVGRCLKLIASTRGTFCYEFASQFGLDFFIRQKTANHCRPHTSIRAAEINNGIGSGRTEETR